MPHKTINLKTCECCPVCKSLSGFGFKLPAKVKKRGYWGSSIEEVIEESVEYNDKKVPKMVQCVDCLRYFYIGEL